VIRRLLIENPKLTLEELIAGAAEAGFAVTKNSASAIMHEARATIRVLKEMGRLAE
jgi:hypothetical protein